MATPQSQTKAAKQAGGKEFGKEFETLLGQVQEEMVLKELIQEQEKRGFLSRLFAPQIGPEGSPGVSILDLLFGGGAASLNPISPFMGNVGEKEQKRLSLQAGSSLAAFLQKLEQETATRERGF